MQQADCDFRLTKLAKTLAAQRASAGAADTSGDLGGFVTVSDSERIEGIAIKYVLVTTVPGSH